MAPLHFSGTSQILATLAIGFGFGFVLERSGFGNARNLAAQFYLYDMRVLKVMFTAIVTAMVLVFASSALGWLEFERVFVPPTYLGPAIVGGFILGLGFIIGGYCPGTSMVSMATLKIDGALFAFGVLCGLLIFSEAVPALWDFWNYAGDYGRLTLFDVLGVDAGLVVVGVVITAVGAFAFAEFMERRFDPNRVDWRPSGREKTLRRAAVAAALGIACVTAVVGQPTVERKMAWKKKQLDAKLEDRSVHIDPAELLGLMHNNQIPLVLLDVRDERDFNVFHLVDARRVTLADLAERVAEEISPQSVVVVMSNDEARAEQGWRRLSVRGNVNAYILAGGINRWLDVYYDKRANVPGPEVPGTGNDLLRHRFARSMGDRPSAARPDTDKTPKREFVTKVQVLGPVREVGGGCG